jgi:CheY-like chemotaxis protein
VNADRAPLRVLLADDHSEMLKAASSVLRDSCDVVSTVSDGLQAVEEAVRLDPDVVVLDITMPGLDGFQAARELRLRGSRAKIVFLSLHEGDEFVATGFRSGGQAFVSKHRMPTDLRSAIEHVQAGRVFVPSLSSLSTVAPRGGHAVMFYSRRSAWCDETAGLVRTALTRGDTVVVFLPEVTRMEIAKRLATHGFDTTQAVTDGRYAVADAAETLQQIMRNGQPDPQRIATVVDNLERTRLAVSEPGSRLTVIGEIAACLRPDQPHEILGIERLWNELAGKRPFLTVCGYSMDFLRHDNGTGQPWPTMCDEHWAVSQVIDE